MPEKSLKGKSPGLVLKLDRPEDRAQSSSDGLKTQPWKVLCQPQTVSYAADTRADYPKIRLQCHKDEHESQGG